MLALAGDGRRLGADLNLSSPGQASWSVQSVAVKFRFAAGHCTARKEDVAYVKENLTMDVSATRGLSHEDDLDQEEIDGL
jgi:hypothetical protein